MDKFDGDMHPDNRLHPSNAPVGSVGEKNKIAERKINHAILLQGTRMGDATQPVVRTHVEKGPRKM